jgi:Major Facilitator Superfamily
MRPAPWLLPLAFGAFGVMWGAWQAVLPDLARHHGLSAGPLGAILTAGFAVSLPAMLGTGRLVDRIGAGWGMAITATSMAAGMLVVSTLSPAIWVLVVGVILMAAGSGAFDVAINGAAMGDADWRRPARMTLLHAGFSGGGLVGALAAGALIGAQLPFRWVYPALGAVLLLTAVLAARSGWHAGPSEGGVPRAVALAMLPLAAVAGLAFLAEGSMETWSAIYLRDELGAAAFVGALGPAAFHAAMLTGRLIGAGVAGTLGAASTLLVAGLMALIGMTVALLVPAPALAIPGMAVSALGASFVVPVVVSLAAARAGGHAGRAASYVLTLGYAGFLIGPSLVGVLGELFGLRVALAVVPVAGAVIVLASRSRVSRG